ncbi:family 43 glycosylhydrolase [Sphingomonas montana]|uniref:family 43 glycosylhydrolase n=1 Tax=Sphingomonas montana TaxID=1843236 RepID=UPI0009F9E3DE|nr:family 43 glycosylhydrolase [Sphingomonas montana]
MSRLRFPAPLRAAMLCAAMLVPIAATHALEPIAAARSPTATLGDAVAKAIRNDPALRAPLRGNVTLYRNGAEIPALADHAGAAAVTITWQSSNMKVISVSDRRTGSDTIAKGTITRYAQDAMVRLTATVSGPGLSPVTVPIDVTVLARPTLTNKQAYLFVYFSGDTVDGEKLRFAVSDGNNALQWKELNRAQPVLTSSNGTLGLRDPFIMRSPEGDRFFLIATDLSAGRTGWREATNQGSRYLEIWESTDLINWGSQRHVEVNLPNAGMTWAPEATYDLSIGAYVVYWSSTLYTDAARTQGDGNGPQMLYATTRDFRTFTQPQQWFKAADLSELVKSRGMIDSTVLRDGDAYYRFTKVTEASGCPSGDIIGQRSSSLRALGGSSAWSVVSRCIGRKAGTPEVEGPSAFVANKGDTSGFKYYLWVDHYRGIGYIPLATNALRGDIKWTYPADFRLPLRPRHGSVLSITAEERDALVAKWGATPVPPPPSAEAVARQLKDAWVIPPVVASASRLPAPQGYSVSWTANGPGLRDGMLVNDGTEPLSLRLTGTIALPGGKSAVKEFAVQVLGKDAPRIVSYARTPTDAHDANQPAVARSLHLALAVGDATPKPMNGNYGVLFAKGDYIAIDRVSERGIVDPALFYFADGSLGVIATRAEISGKADASQASSALMFKADPANPADFTELGLIDLRTTAGVNRPTAVWDATKKRYLVSWTTDDSIAQWTTVEDLARTENTRTQFHPENGGRRSRIVSAGNVGQPRLGGVATITAPAPDMPGVRNARALPVGRHIVAALTNRFGRIVNARAQVDPLTITPGNIQAVINARARLDYSDGSTATRAVDWDPADLRRLATARTGTIAVRGTIRQKVYPKIFAFNRADPTIYAYTRKGRTKYLFTATDDTDNRNVGSVHLPIRIADSIDALADDNGGRAREIDLLNRKTRLDRTVEGKMIAGCYWAPEIHEIGGRLSILFAPCFNPTDDQSNEGGLWSTVQSHIIQLRPGGDPANPAHWSKPAAILKRDRSALGRRDQDKNISLDMSYFVSGGQAYYIWSQRYLTASAPPGDPLTWIAKVNPANPTRLLSEPRPIIAPNLSFEEHLAEGAFAQFHNGRVHLVYSGSSVSPTYVVGGVWAKEGADLTDIDSWHKWKAPLQKSRSMPAGVNDFLNYEQGTGHGSFTADSDGNPIYVYHTWGDGVGGNGRDTRLRRIHWAADGHPVLDMMPEEEIGPKNRTLSVQVTIKRLFISDNTH